MSCSAAGRPERSGTYTANEMRAAIFNQPASAGFFMETEMAMSEHSIIAHEMAFAQVVSTEKGDGLLIGGSIYHVEGPNGNAADAFARALRSGRADGSVLAARAYENAPLADAPAGPLASDWVFGATLGAYATGAFAKAEETPVDPAVRSRVTVFSVCGSTFQLSGVWLEVEVTEIGLQVSDRPEGHLGGKRVRFISAHGNWAHYSVDFDQAEATPADVRVGE